MHFQLTKGHFYFLLIALLCGELLVSVRINAHRASLSSRLELLTGFKAERKGIEEDSLGRNSASHTA